MLPQSKKKLSYNCCECNQCFAHKYSLRRHKQVTHRLERFYCEHCKCRYSRKDSWQRHVNRTHNNENRKPQSKKKLSYKCGECNQCFAYKYSLQRHKRITHRRERFYCEHCKMSYARKDNWQRHMNRTHNIEYLESQSKKCLMTYSCRECSHCFAHKSSLERHKQVAHIQAKFYCGLCNLRFTRKDSWQRHMKKTHNIVQQIPAVMSSSSSSGDTTQSNSEPVAQTTRLKKDGRSRAKKIMDLKAMFPIRAISQLTEAVHLFNGDFETIVKTLKDGKFDRELRDKKQKNGFHSSSENVKQFKYSLVMQNNVEGLDNMLAPAYSEEKPRQPISNRGKSTLRLHCSWKHDDKVIIFSQRKSWNIGVIDVRSDMKLPLLTEVVKNSFFPNGENMQLGLFIQDLDYELVTRTRHRLTETLSNGETFTVGGAYLELGYHLLSLYLCTYSRKQKHTQIHKCSRQSSPDSEACCSSHRFLTVKHEAGFAEGLYRSRSMENILNRRESGTSAASTGVGDVGVNETDTVMLVMNSEDDTGYSSALLQQDELTGSRVDYPTPMVVLEEECPDLKPDPAKLGRSNIVVREIGEVKSAAAERHEVKPDTEELELSNIVIREIGGVRPESEELEQSNILREIGEGKTAPEGLEWSNIVMREIGEVDSDVEELSSNIVVRQIGESQPTSEGLKRPHILREIGVNTDPDKLQTENTMLRDKIEELQMEIQQYKQASVSTQSSKPVTTTGVSASPVTSVLIGSTCYKELRTTSIMATSEQSSAVQNSCDSSGQSSNPLLCLPPGPVELVRTIDQLWQAAVAPSTQTVSDIIEDGKQNSRRQLQHSSESMVVSSPMETSTCPQTINVVSHDLKQTAVVVFPLNNIALTIST